MAVAGCDLGSTTPCVTPLEWTDTKRSPSYRLTEDLAASHGGEVICLHPLALGQRYRLFASRQGPEQNIRLVRDAFGVSLLHGSRADVISPGGEVTELDGDIDEEPTFITRVDIRGPLEQRSGYHDICAGWSDGHDAVAERMIAALEEGDVLLVIDSPGGAAAGLQEAVRRVVEAKAEHGRHVIAYADEMIGSAAYWWAASVADEIYGPASMIVGSIGARAAHGSIAGALAKEGVEVTHFAWPGAGKVAFASELPLSDVGRMRGNRDVAITGEAFAAAVGPRRGMTRDEIVELDADALPGVLAVDAKLVDGIASLEDVMEYALALAAPEPEPGDEDDMKTKNRPAKPGVTAKTRSEDPDPKKKTPDPKKKIPADPEESLAEPEPEQVPASDKKECDKCGAANDDDAKYCDKCGEPMDGAEVEPDGDETPEEARAEGDDEDDDDDDEDEDDASDDDKKDDDKKKKKGARAAPPLPEERRAAAPSHAGSLASIFGLREGASHPAIKSAAIAYANLGRAVMNATGTRSPSEAQGALRSLAEDAAEAMDLRTSLAASRKREVRREKMELLKNLAAANLPGYARGELLVDREVKGKLVTGPAQMFDEMPIATLRGFVNGKLKGQAPAGPGHKRTPFDPDPNRARTFTENALVEADLSTPFIQDVAARSTASAEQLARTARALEAQGAR